MSAAAGPRGSHANWPVWSLQIMNAEDLERQAAVLRQEADGRRCRAVESGGFRCTADATPLDHQCRYDETELP